MVFEVVFDLKRFLWCQGFTSDVPGSPIDSNLKGLVGVVDVSPFAACFFQWLLVFFVFLSFLEGLFWDDLFYFF